MSSSFGCSHLYNLDASFGINLRQTESFPLEASYVMLMALQQLFLHLHLRGRQIVSSQPWQLLLNIHAALRVAILAFFLEAFSSCFQLLSDLCSNPRVAPKLIFGELALVKLQLVISTLP